MMENMDNDSQKWAVILIGPPGSGKDTQAELLAQELGLVHIQTSKLIEAKFKDGGDGDPALTMEKQKWASGELNSHDFVLALVRSAVELAHRSGKGAVLSGSPREVEEASLEMPILDTLYGKDNIKVVNIRVSPEESLKRNSRRRICQANRHPIPDIEEYRDIKVCPQDGSPVVTRELDDPDIIRHRYEVYRKQTEPVIDFLSKQGYNIITIDGERSIEDVHRDILNHLW